MSDVPPSKNWTHEYTLKSNRKSRRDARARAYVHRKQVFAIMEATCFLPREIQRVIIWWFNWMYFVDAKSAVAATIKNSCIIYTGYAESTIQLKRSHSWCMYPKRFVAELLIEKSVKKNGRVKEKYIDLALRMFHKSASMLLQEMSYRDNIGFRMMYADGELVVRESHWHVMFFCRVLGVHEEQSLPFFWSLI